MRNKKQLPDNVIQCYPNEEYRSALKRWNRRHPDRAVDTWVGALQSDLIFEDGVSLRQAVEDTFEKAGEEYEKGQQQG